MSEQYLNSYFCQWKTIHFNTDKAAFPWPWCIMTAASHCILVLHCRSFYFKEIKELNKPECIYLCSFLFYLNKGQYGEREFLKSASETGYSNLCLSYFQSHGASKLRASSTHLCLLLLCIQVKNCTFHYVETNCKEITLLSHCNHISVPPAV